MQTTTTEPRNWTYLTGRAIGGGFLVGALAASYTHIVHLFSMMGTHGWQGWTAPIFIDGFALLGRLARSKNFAPETRKVGLTVQIAATSVSFIANVIAGQTIGDKVFGALVVIGYILAELLVERMHPVATKTEMVKATRSAAATKAAATRATNKAEADRKAAEKAERTRLARLAKRAEMDALNASYALPNAPISPAPVDYDTAPYL